MVDIKEVFIKIPNSFFYKRGKLFKSIGGKKAFILYMLLTNRKNIENKVYINKAEINKIINIDTNTSRARKNINNMLFSLREYNLISFNDDILKSTYTEFIKVRWKDWFSNGESGWIAFYANDFSYYEKFGDTMYCVMWLIRMYENSKTKTSFVAIKDMAELTQSSSRDVYDAIIELEECDMVIVERGDCWYSKKDESYLKANNTYRFNRRTN